MEFKEMFKEPAWVSVAFTHQDAGGKYRDKKSNPNIFMMAQMKIISPFRGISLNPDVILAGRPGGQPSCCYNRTGTSEVPVSGVDPLGKEISLPVLS